MSARVLSLQDRFLNGLRRAKVPVTLFLVKGIKLQGLITSFDTFSVLLRRDGASQLIYKHSISTIVPAELPGDLDLQSPDDVSPAARAGLQDLFLAAAAREREQVTLFLVNGVMLQGSIRAFDQFSVLLERSGQAQLVYKHAISTLQPDHPLTIDAAPLETAGEMA